MWDIWCVICVMSDVRCLTSWRITDIRLYRMSDVICLKSYGRHLMSAVGMISDVCYLVSDVWCLSYYFLCMVSDVSRAMYDVLCVMSDVLSEMSEVRSQTLCQMQGGRGGVEENRLPLCRWAPENIRISSLFATGNVSRGGTSATQRQKFHTDDAKSVRNPVRSTDWSTEELHCFSYCLRMTDKKTKRHQGQM